MRSMTGFGKGTEKSPYGKIIAEVKTLNHKSLSVACSPFQGFFLLEEKVKDVFEGKVHRGKVFVQIRRETKGGQKPLKHTEINKEAASSFLKQVRSMQKSLGIAGEIGIKELISLPGIVEIASEESEGKVWPYIKKALDKAVDRLVKFRKAEGRRLAGDFQKRLNKLKKLNGEIAKYSSESVVAFAKKLTETVEQIKQGGESDKGKIEAEAGLFARNTDVTEEVIRLGGHIVSFLEAMKAEEDEAGKKLDFVAQEMQREANTIGSKAADIRMSRAVIDIKSEIEKMREQIKNIE
jgi:uncharacterized protein (TIGR00255 family)